MYSDTYNYDVSECSLVLAYKQPDRPNSKTCMEYCNASTAKFLGFLNTIRQKAVSF